MIPEECQCCHSDTGKGGRPLGPLVIRTNHGQVGPLCETCYTELHGAWVDSVWACLLAAGAPEDERESEIVVKACGDKPSDYIRAKFKMLTEHIGELQDEVARLKGEPC